MEDPRKGPWSLALLLLALSVFVPMTAWGQDAAVESDASSGPTVTPSGALEVLYSFNPAHPSNGVNAHRLNEGRDRSFTISMLVLALDMSWGPISAHLAGQYGQVSETYYLAEPALRGGGGVADTDPSVWSHLQEAYLDVSLGRRVKFGAGLFLSPVGPESMVTNAANNTLPGADAPNAANAFISRGFNFYGLPYYHTAVRAIADLGRGFSLRGWIMNGWNSVGADNNGTPTGVVNLQYTSRRLAGSALVMVGSERPAGAPEGQRPRWMWDSWVQWHPHRAFAVIGQLNAGFERHRFGVSSWLATSLAVRWHPIHRFSLAARGEFFPEWIPSGPSGTAAPIFWGGASSVASATITVAWRPNAQTLVRLEYRRDWSGGQPRFYQGDVAGDGSAAHPFVANSFTQQTLTLAANVWF